jgi:hypothetical protein
MKLAEFVNTKYNGIKAVFARSIGILPTTVTKYYKRDNCHVYKVDGDWILMNATKNLSAEMRKIKADNHEK